MIDVAIISELIKASPYLAFILLFLWVEAKREDRRVLNAKALEDRRETHEKEMQARQLQQDRDINNLWASYIQQIVDEIKTSNRAIMQRIDEHEKESEDRYERIGITKDLLKAASERTRR
jgi:hypothetical protein